MGITRSRIIASAPESSEMARGSPATARPMAPRKHSAATSALPRAGCSAVTGVSNTKLASSPSARTRSQVPWTTSVSPARSGWSEKSCCAG